MTVEEKLDELDPNIMGIDWEKIEEPMRRECLEKLEKRRADARVYNALQKYAKEQTRLGIPFLFHEEALHGLPRRDATIFPQQLTLAGAFEPAPVSYTHLDVYKRQAFAGSNPASPAFDADG